MHFLVCTVNVSKKTSLKNDSSHNEGQLRYIRYVNESYGEGLLTKMHSYLWLLDFHDL